MRKRWTTAAICLVLPAVMGTSVIPPERPDEIRLDGKSHPLYSYPLEGWFGAHPDARLPSAIPSMLNKRGYTAHWEIRGGALWLTRVEAQHTRKPMWKKKAAVLPAPDSERCKVESEWEWHCEWKDKLFPGGGETRADWYSGLLIVPVGDSAGLGLNFASAKDRYIVHWVSKGMILRRLELNRDQFDALRRDRFEAFKKTSPYRKHFNETRQYMEERTEDYLFYTLDWEYLSVNLPALPAGE